MDPLHKELALHEKYKAELKEQFPDDSDADLHDTLEGLTDLNELICYIIRSCEDDEAMIVGLKERVKEFQDRLSRLQLRVDKKRDSVAAVMERAELKKITAPEFTISLRTISGKLKVVDDDKLPEKYWKVRREPDKTAINAADKSGEEVPGTVRGNGYVSITVRKK